MPSLDGWANLLRVLDLAGVDRRELPRLTRLSKRAVRVRMSAAVRRGWAEELTSGRGQSLLRLTGQGVDVVARWERLQQSSESRWQEHVGSDRATALSAALGTVVAALPLEHPHYPATYGTVDASITGGRGQDWRPVPRQGSDSIADLSMCALLSQALVAFALEYEELSPVAFSISASILRRVPPEGRPLRDIGMSVHLSAMDRHGFLRLDGVGDNATVFLTTKGRGVSDAYTDRVELVEQTWRERSGSDTVRNLRQLLENTTDRTPPDESPDVAQPAQRPGLAT